MRRFDDAFLALAVGRIQKALMVFTAAAAIALFPVQGWRVSAGVAMGGSLALMNFVWMRQSMVALSDRMADLDSLKKVRSTVIMRFFFRYAILVITVFAIISRSAPSAEGVIFGLLLVVPALIFEAIYEAAHGLRSVE